MGFYDRTRSNLRTMTHLHLSGMMVRPVWPWQQVRHTVVRTGGGAGSMNIHYDVTGLLTVAWRSHSGEIVWAAWIGQDGGGSELIAHIRVIQECACSRQLDRWRWPWPRGGSVYVPAGGGEGVSAFNAPPPQPTTLHMVWPEMHHRFSGPTLLHIQI